jgi:hypothetical protein
MSKTTRFIVEIVTSEKVELDEEKNEMAQNVADAIIEYAQNNNICPHYVDGYVEIVYVKEWYSDKQIIEHP